MYDTNRCKCRFLLVSLKVDTILAETTIHRRRNRLNVMGDGLGLGDAYGATLERIKTQEGEKAKLAMTTLMWICYSERPLRVDELCHALAVEIGSAHFNNDNVPAIDTLLVCCQGLVMVDKEASTVRLIHHTLREYLCTHHSLFSRAHLAMGETCLTYLNSEQAKALPAKPQPDLSSMPFLKYCSRYWGTHAKRELSDHAKSLAMGLLEQYENHVAAHSLFEQILDLEDSLEADTGALFAGLHCVSFFGIVDVMAGLLGMDGCDANRRDSAGITPLIWAVRGKQEDAVELLLGQEAVDPNTPDNAGNTSLSWAAIMGYGSVVKQLLKRQDVTPDKPDNEGRTPLLWAAGLGHELVVNQLLGREDVYPDKPDNEGRTVLSWAASQGHELVVNQLLGREDVNPDKPGNEGGTPLSWAASQGHELVVNQLLGREDVNPDKPDNEGRTPLLWAASQGHESVVKQLLDREDVNPDKPDNEGNTPLSWAAIKGRESVVNQLLDRQDVNPDKPDDEGRTPLSWAAGNGHESVVKQLLDREDVNPTGPDNSCHIPLWHASAKGHGAVVDLLQAWQPPIPSWFAVDELQASLPSLSL